MKKEKKNTLNYQLKTFRFAFNGLKWFFASEAKSRIHIACACAVLLAGIAFKISPVEWIVLTFAIGFVFVAEILNTCIEMLVDRNETGNNPMAGRIKDLAAGAVLIAALTSLIVGGIVFIPKVISFVF